MTRPDSGFDYVSPWPKGQPSGLDQETRAAQAFIKLTRHFFEINPGLLGNDQLDNRTRRIHHAVKNYSALSIRAAAEGIAGDQRRGFIMKGLQADALIDPNDPNAAEVQFTIISEGYELNRTYWDEQLGRMRRIRNNPPEPSGNEDYTITTI